MLLKSRLFWILVIVIAAATTLMLFRHHRTPNTTTVIQGTKTISLPQIDTSATSQAIPTQQKQQPLPSAKDTPTAEANVLKPTA